MLLGQRALILVRGGRGLDVKRLNLVELSETPADAGRSPAKGRSHLGHGNPKGGVRDGGRLGINVISRTFIGICRRLATRMKNHLNYDDEEYRGKGDGSGKSRVIGRKEATQAGVAEGEESRGQQMDKGSSDENARAKVADGEEEAAGDTHAGDLCCQNRKSAGCGGDEPDDEDCASV